ncbi:MAG: tRNA (N(6)-L-threonylcarbamoyladenosine(37)-C(2))-methylthiotransferase MtaB [Clostridia bacterium]|nr:tRNA (N(6)-L-threonylcarbamoyladenosine(37)-C(2))-methylthiotransferase MtaB [Clostridia bacterium]
MTVGFYTLGCKVNQYESHMLRSIFEANGYLYATLEEHPDVIIVNSCTVTAESDRKTRQAVRRFRRQSPASCIVLTGCMPQAFPQEAQALLQADVVAGNRNNHEIFALVQRFLQTGERQLAVQEHKAGEPFVCGEVGDFHERTRAFLKIEDGCDRFCTYCIIPKARGRVRSKPPQKIREEAQALAKKGYRELVLVGINLSDYGKDLGVDLGDAVEQVAGVEGIDRIRLGSLEPDQMTDEMLQRLADCKKFCPQFHLSLQSGCDKTLKHMNRHYDSAFYRNLVQRLRRQFENASVTTDVMVGFAGESQADFEDSLNFVREIGFARAHVFAYSVRKGTPAANYPNQVPEEIKRRRSEAMIAAAAECEQKFLQTQVGTVQDVLFEQRGEDGYEEGYTPNYTPVKVCTTQDLTGKVLPIKIISAQADHCRGITEE